MYSIISRGREWKMARMEDGDLKTFFDTVIERTQDLFDRYINSDPRNEENSGSQLLIHLDLLDKTVELLDKLEDVCDGDDVAQLNDLKMIFINIVTQFRDFNNHLMVRTTTISSFSCSNESQGRPGRPAFIIPIELLEDLRGMGFSWTQISNIFQVSRWTIMRRVQQYNLGHLNRFTSISDDQIDEIIRNYMLRHGSTTGESYLIGHFRALGYHVQRRRIRSSINRVDPQNVAIRWGALVSRRVYFVPWPNSLWHIDGHHSLIRWGFVIHGCVDGFSRRIMFIHCSTNNLASTVLDLFLTAIQETGGFWPSRIRVDYGVENTAICDAMVATRGEGRGSFIAGSSTRNQRIERLWRDVFRCVCHAFYYTFYAMEQTGILDIENPIHLLTMQWVFRPRINHALHEWSNGFNNHPVRTEHNWTPNQMWSNGMLNVNNPLAVGGLDNDVYDTTLYGIDGEAQPFFESSASVEVFPPQIPNISTIELFQHLEQTMSPLQESTNFGIDIFIFALTIVVEWLRNQV